ncbi:hypothetical protein LY76DRAFT_609656 [Colletotrichum caudatum]|nr:hypothetical protein LY76DRAFT_609656 [Colletotrichum caudatum]
MSGHGRDHDRAGFNPHLGGTRRHFAKRRTEDEASDEDVVTNTVPKRPRLTNAAPDYTAVKLSHEDYTVGWVCALPLERAAAEAMLDEEHDPLAMKPNDSNVYSFGRIGPHNTVIACLPSGQYGTNSAAVVANNMRWSFPSMRVGLMVGIGGGVPGKVDIRLGDVVVSNPTGDSSGVVQYDFGKAVHDGRFERIGTLNKPPQSVLTAVAKLRANHEMWPNRIPAFLADMEQRYPKMSEYLYKSMDEDRLFQALYEHTGGDTCNDCDISKVVEREPRPAAATPKIHYGIIASGNQVIKHAQTRDRLAKDLGIICFEMEAAGLMDNFPCLVVRGICDYSDSHKAKRWQRYAAATAAAYTKELLYCFTPQEEASSTAQTAAPDTVRSLPPSDHRKVLLDSLKFSQIDKRQANIKAVHAKTCEWLVQHPDYAAWMDRQKYAQHHGFLWIRGKPGAGKSTLMKFAFTRAKRRKSTHETLISFFFNARGEELEKTTLGMYRSLVYQLLDSIPDLQTLLDDPDLAPLGHPDSEGWGLEQLKDLFRSAVRGLGDKQLTCFIDALDECDDNEVSDMVKCFEDLGQFAVQNDTRFYVCFSSRHYPQIDIFYGRKLALEDQFGHRKDLEDYVRSELRAGSGSGSQKVIDEILRKASGVFMWVVLVVNILNNEYRRGRIFVARTRIRDIPSELSKLFQNILTRDQEDTEDLLLCIQLLLYSQRPLKRREYYFAIASGLEPDALEEWDAEDITLEVLDRLIVSSSKGLAEATKSDDRTVQFIHESVRDFLFKDDGLRTLWPDMSDNYEGRSQDRVNIMAYLPDDKFLFNKSIERADFLRGPRTKVAERFPFLDYATNQVLHHAEAAAVHGIPQDKFVEDFAVDLWIQMNNLFERTMICLQRNLDVDKVGGRYKYPLLATMVEGHEETANVLLDHIANNSHRPGGCNIGPILDYESEKGETPLFYAAQSKDINIAKKLFELGASPEFRNTRYVNSSPLVRAVEKNNEAFVRLFLHERSKSSLSRVRSPSRLASSDEEHDGEEGLEVPDERTMPSSGEDGQTPILSSKTCDEDVSHAANAAIAKLLLASGAEMESAGKYGRTPLHFACFNGHLAFAEMLVEAGAKLDSRDEYGGTPLHIACNNGDPKTASFLLKVGAEVEATNNNFMTPLLYALLLEEMACLDVLLSHGANINRRDNRGRTPVFDAIRNSGSQYFQRFLEKQPDITITDHSGQTPLFELQTWRSNSILSNAKLLVEAGVDAAHRNNKGQTFLHVNFGCVQWVLEQGFDVNARDNTSRTPLLEAVKEGYAKLVTLLIHHGADLDAADDHGWTPLSAAIACHDDSKFPVLYAMKLAIFLLENGADPGKPGPNGEGLVDMAVRKGIDELIEPLKEAMRKRSMMQLEECA